MESKGKFRLKLSEVASELEMEKLEKLKYSCSGPIPAGDLEKIETPDQLFVELEQRKLIEPNRLQFLIDRLKTVGRKDLADDLKSYECERTEGKQFLSHFTNDVRVLVETHMSGLAVKRSFSMKLWKCFWPRTSSITFERTIEVLVSERKLLNVTFLLNSGGFFGFLELESMQ